MPCGSSRCLTARSTSTPSGPISRSIQGRWSAPTAWWWVSVPPAPSSASVAARLAGEPLLDRQVVVAVGEHGHVQRGAGRVAVRDVAHDQRTASVAGQRLPQRPADGVVHGGQRRPGGRRLQRLDQQAAVQELVAQVGRREAVPLPRLPDLAAQPDRPAVPEQRGGRLRPGARPARAAPPSRGRAGSRRRGRGPGGCRAGPAPRRRRPSAGWPGSRRRRRAGRRRAAGRAAPAAAARRARPPRSGTTSPRTREAARLGAHPQRQLGDDAERALGAQGEAEQVGAGGGGRRVAELQHAGRRGEGQPGDQLVEAADAGGVLPGRAGGRVAAEGGELPALRQVAEGEALAATAPARAPARACPGPR